jgi:hypothetical protein
MKPIRHISPKYENNLSNIYFKSPKKSENNIINFNNPSNNKNFNINNKINFKNNNIEFDYYEEINKAFNFITFVLKQKDNQIRELKIIIKKLENQLNDLNDKNLMTFKKKEIIEDSSLNKDNLNANKFKRTTYNNNQNKPNQFSTDSDNKKYNQLTHNIFPTQKSSNNNNLNKNANNLKINDKSSDNDNINILHKIKNSTNINKINNYRNNIEQMSKQSINKYVNSEIVNKQINMNINMNMNMNINEHSSEKKNINKIRKVPYHTNQNIKFRNGSGNKYKNYNTETEYYTGNEKMKILTFDNSMSNLGKPNSKSNSFTLSDDGNIIKSKIEVKNYLKEIKKKLEPEKFKKFITLIKKLIKNKNTELKNQYVFEIKNVLNDNNLISKFENIMKLK